MDASPSGSIILIFILVFINAFFASAEMAIVSINKTRISLLAQDGNKKAQQILTLIKEPSNFLATIQVGITLAGFFASASAATSLSGSLGKTLNDLGVPYGDTISLVLVTIIISFVTLILGELLPKRIALQKAESIAMATIMPITIISKIAKPFVLLLSFTTNILLKIVGVDTDGIEEKVSKEEIQSLIQIGEEQGTLNEDERDMIDGIIEFDDKLAKEIMTPRTEVFMLELNSSLKDNMDIILTENFSRIPVYKDDIDNIVGILYMKDLFSAVVNNGLENIKISNIIRQAYFAPETNTIDKVFKKLKENQNYMAILIDEYGGFSGIVTMEDLIEEVMGNIEDEYDDNEPEIEKVDTSTYIVSGLLTLNEINNNIGLELSSNSTDTIGGFLMEIIGTIPSKGLIVPYENIKFKIEELDDKRIHKVLIKLD